MFSTTFTETFLILRRTEKDMIKELTLVFTLITQYSCLILIKLEFSRQMFKKFLNVTFHANSSSGRRLAPCRQTDRYGEANRLFLQFLNPPKKELKGAFDA